MAYQKVYMNQIHSSSLLSQLSEMWKRDILCDAVITTGSVNTKAHRLVLVAACPMLQSMDSTSIGNKLDVKLSPDIDKEAVMSFLHYLYDGFMTLTEDNVRDIEKIARLLQVNSVTKCCNDFFKVYEETVGQVIGSSQKFSVNTDITELRHIKTSDLQRLVQHCSSKRNMDGEEMSSRKRAKLNKQMANLSHVSRDDSFKIIQSEFDNTENHCQSRSSVERSLSVSIVSRAETTDGNVQVYVADDNETTATSSASSLMSSPHQFGHVSPHTTLETSASPNLDLSSSKSASNSFTKPKSFHRPYSPVSRLINANKPKMGFPIMSQLDPNYHSYKQAKTNSKDTSAKPQNSWTITHPERQRLSQSSPLSNLDDQIIIEPINGDYQSATLGEGLSPIGDVDLSTSLTGIEQSEESIGERQEQTSGSKGHEENTASSHMPDLSRVKVERETVSEPYSLMSGPHDDSSYPYIEENEEETSDTDYSYHGDTSRTDFTEAERAAFWYTQTFKDVLESEKKMSGIFEEQKKQPIVQKRQMDKFMDKNWIHGKIGTLTIQQRLLRALTSMKSPVVFLRPLQRKVSGGLKIDVLKAGCEKLANQGFGQFTLKNNSNVLQRDTFFKPAPDQLDQNDPFLASVHVSHEYYRSSYNDISQLTEEEISLICAVHPDKKYIHRLCQNVVDTQSVLIRKMEKVESTPVIHGTMPTTHGNFGTNGEHLKPNMNPLMCLEMTASRFFNGKPENQSEFENGVNNNKVAD